MSKETQVLLIFMLSIIAGSSLSIAIAITSMAHGR